MSSATAACPFCNSELPPLASAPTAPQIPCPRCGEPVASGRFPVRCRTLEHDSPLTPHPPGTADGQRKTLRIVLSIMVGMAAFALVFALLTQQTRRKNDFKNKPETNVYLAQNPAKLLGLAYLPRGTHLVAGLHVTALRQTEAGAALLGVPRPEPIAKALEVLEQVGIALEDVDHVVVGYDLSDIPPQLTTVIVTSTPYGASQVREAVARQPFHESVYRHKTLYKLTQQPRIPKLWCADPQVLVWTTLKTEDLDRIAATTSIDALTPDAHKAIEDRLGRQSRVWAVGDLAPVKGLADLAQGLGFLPKEQARLLGLVRSFAIGITAEDQDSLALSGDFYTGDPGASRELGKYLQEVEVRGASSRKAAIPPADITEAEAQWVTWQVRGDAQAMRDALGKLHFAPPKRR